MALQRSRFFPSLASAVLFAACGPTIPVVAPLTVTFAITNNGSSNHCGGGVGAHDVDNVTLKQSITGVETVQHGTVPSGYTRDIPVIIPKDDTYDVFVYAVDYCCNPGSGCVLDPAIFMHTPLAAGQTYVVNLAGGTASTLGTAHSTGSF
jgi:hypothetical protein